MKGRQKNEERDREGVGDESTHFVGAVVRVISIPLKLYVVS